MACFFLDEFARIPETMRQPLERKVASGVADTLTFPSQNRRPANRWTGFGPNGAWVLRPFEQLIALIPEFLAHNCLDRRYRPLRFRFCEQFALPITVCVIGAIQALGGGILDESKHGRVSEKRSFASAVKDSEAKIKDEMMTTSSFVKVRQLEKEIFDLKLLNGGKDFVIDQLRKERDGFIQQIVEGSRQIGALESELRQLTAGRGHSDGRLPGIAENGRPI